MAMARVFFRTSRVIRVTKNTYDDAVTPAPAISSLNYDQGDTLGGGQSVVITGTDLTGASVSFGGTAATVTNNTSTTVTCTLPAKAAGATTVTVTTAGGTSNGLSFTFWDPVSEPNVTLVAETPDYSSPTWVLRYGGPFRIGTAGASNIPEVVGEAGTPNFDGTGYLNTQNAAFQQADVLNFLAVTGGTLCSVVKPSNEENPEIGGSTPYGNSSFMVKQGSGPIGIYNAGNGSSSWFGLFCFDNMSASYKLVKATVAGLVGSYHSVVGTYAQGVSFSLSADASPLGDATAAFAANGHPLAYTGSNPIALGSDYSSTDLAWRGHMRAVAYFNAVKDDIFTYKFHAWARQRFGI